MHHVYTGTFVDFDLGNPSDDYIGTNVELGLIYTYNGDPIDETNGAPIGFNENPPAVGILFLEGSKLENDGLDNPIGVDTLQSINGLGFGDGIIDNEKYTLESSRIMTNAGNYPYSDANNVHGFYNNLQGLYNMMVV